MLQRLCTVAGLAALLSITACADAGVGADEDGDKESIGAAQADGKSDGIDWCENRGWYNDGACDQFCLRPDPDCNSTPLGDAPQGHATLAPIILVHGFMGTQTSALWSFYKVKAALEADGHRVFEADLPAFDAPSARAQILAQQIDAALAATGAHKINIIAHSQGGLDSRYLISSLGYGDRVASLTTISSPHRGTAIADRVLGFIPGGLDGTVNAALRVLKIDVAAVNVRAALTAMSERNMVEFNRANPDDSRVMYQSWAGVSSPTGVASTVDLSPCDGKLLIHPNTMDRLSPLLPSLVWNIVGHNKRDANDGVATVTSAKWGTFRGCIPADHMDEVGRIAHTFDRATGFDHLRFYRTMAFDLAAQGL